MRNTHKTATLAAALLVLAATLGLSACSTTEPVGRQVDDAALTAKVKTKLTADPEVNPFTIDVDTTDGVVTLRGRVDESGDRAEAVKLARETEGVRGVHDELTVGPAPNDEAPGTDAAIATKVKAKLTADPEVSSLNVDVDVEDGVVTLSGLVRSEYAKNHAEEVAARVEGVKSVRNEIRVTASK
jgi:hyperosmotically inducible protein